jgi:hypothetical protein
MANFASLLEGINNISLLGILLLLYYYIFNISLFEGSINISLLLI